MKGQLKVSTPKEYFAKLKEPRKSDVVALDKLIRKANPKLKPYIHSGMLAYGHTTLKYASGRELEWFKIGIASNASYISMYVTASDGRGYVAAQYRDVLPKAKIGKGCITFKALDDLDPKALTKLFKAV